MFCPKCKFTSSDHLNDCPKCGTDWTNAKKTLELTWLTPEAAPWFAATDNRSPAYTAQTTPGTKIVPPAPEAPAQQPTPSSQTASEEELSLETGDIEELLAHAAEPSANAPAEEAAPAKTQATENSELEIELDVEDILASLEQDRSSSHGESKG